MAATIHFNSGLFIRPNRLMMLLGEWFVFDSVPKSATSSSGPVSIPAWRPDAVLHVVLLQNMGIRLKMRSAINTSALTD